MTQQDLLTTKKGDFICLRCGRSPLRKGIRQEPDGRIIHIAKYPREECGGEVAPRRPTDPPRYNPRTRKITETKPAEPKQCDVRRCTTLAKRALVSDGVELLVLCNLHFGIARSTNVVISEMTS